MNTITQLITVTPADLSVLIQKAIIAAQDQFTKPLPPAEEKLLSRKEAARELGVSLNTLDSYSLKGVVKAYRLDRQIRYKKSELINSLVPFKLK